MLWGGVGLVCLVCWAWICCIWLCHNDVEIVMEMAAALAAVVMTI